MWLPPAFKSGNGPDEPGYAVYDLYDLGEFDQQGSIHTRYGTVAEYCAAIEALHQQGIQVIADIVLNHRIGADEKELVWLQPVDTADRRLATGPPLAQEMFTRFTFPGRQGKYSQYVWDQFSFTGLSQAGNIYL